jgi:hypothetical protein
MGKWMQNPRFLHLGTSCRVIMKTIDNLKQVFLVRGEWREGEKYIQNWSLKTSGEETRRKVYKYKMEEDTKADLNTEYGNSAGFSWLGTGSSGGSL